ncbi:MAG: TIGR04325 family methyltransferase [Lysobacter sp.]
MPPELRRNPLRGNLRRIANETAELPGIRELAKPLYRRMFSNNREGNAYLGVYPSFQSAMDAAPRDLPTSYDHDLAGQLYRDRLQRVTVSDYPVIYWLQQLVAGGGRRVFDLGGHVGVTYYSFRRYLEYPGDLQWLVHDTPSVVTAGREWASQNDPWRQLAFADTVDAASDRDVLIACGSLQYLDYSLPELLGRIADPPPHVLVNTTPMHPDRSYFTLQNIGSAICPYRITAVPEFIDDMAALGYKVIDRWESFERHLRLPFEPGHSIDRYYGFYLRLGA